MKTIAAAAIAILLALLMSYVLDTFTNISPFYRGYIVGITLICSYFL